MGWRADMHTDNGNVKVAVHVFDHGVRDGVCATTLAQR